MSYTNAQLRSILNGLGYGYAPEPDPNFPLSSFEGPLVDKVTLDAIKAFQSDFNLTVDGIVGPQTTAKAEQTMYVLQAQLDQVVDAGLPLNQPFYGPRTVAAVKEFQRRYGFAVDGVANSTVRRNLLELTQREGVC